MAAEDAGIAHKLITKADAEKAFSEALEAWKRDANGNGINAAGCWSWRQMAAGCMAILALRLMSLLHPTSQLYFANNWKVSAEETMKAAWPLGVYLSRFK